MEFDPSSWDLWSQNYGLRTEIVEKFTFPIGDCACGGVSISVKVAYEIEIFRISRFSKTLYRSSILIREYDIRPVPVVSEKGGFLIARLLITLTLKITHTLTHIPHATFTAG
jgi:hypothetical protein